ncbi:hypothetical protein [Nonlabens sp.]|uniref:hypothetical protein n=1 Tax=Nonlabens sp. TaxID=1888209 RepID=UPI00326667D0
MSFKNIIVTALLISNILTVTAQVGIGTIDPQPETLLDISSENKGFLIPRISVDNFETYTLPVGSQTESVLIYNTNEISGKGFTSWTGTKWNHINNDFFWSTYGDKDIPVSNFLGTTDSRSFILATAGIPRLEFTTDSRFLAYNDGAITSPSWSIRNRDLGAYSTGDNLVFSANNIDFLSSSNTTGITLNPNQSDVDLTIESSSSSIIEIDSSIDRIGIASTAPLDASLHIQGVSSKIRIESLDSSHPYNNGLDKSVLYVDSNGEFTLEPTPNITQLPQFEFESGYLNTATRFRSPTLGAQSRVIYTTTQQLFEDGLLEVVYQNSISVNRSGGAGITDGLPRKYGVRIKVNGRVVGQTAKMYTCGTNIGSIASGFMYLNGKGYVPLTGSTTGTMYTIEVEAFVDGGGNDTEIVYGSSTNDFFEVIVHY